MPTGEPRVSVERIRAALRVALQRDSSHTLADDIGMSAPAIREFARGSSPHPPNLRKLTLWYVRYLAGEVPGEMDARTAAAALTLFTEHLAPEDRADAREGFYAWLDGITVRAIRRPAWVEEMRAVEEPG